MYKKSWKAVKITYISTCLSSYWYWYDYDKYVHTYLHQKSQSGKNCQGNWNETNKQT